MPDLGAERVDKVKKLEDYVINIPDFPKPGIIFRDITSILRDPEGLKLSVQRIVFVDDLLATGGTAKAAIDLIEELGGVVVKVLFVMELEGLHGRDVLKGYDVESVITYPGK